MRPTARPHPLALVALALATLLGAGPPRAGAATLPPGFTDQVLPHAFDVPTKIAFLPDGRLLVAEKGGIVYVVTDSSLTSMWVREEEVLNADERGLVSIAVDPNFSINRRLYFLYTCDPDSDGIELDDYDDAYCRLTRYELPSVDASVVDAASRTVLMGTGWSDGWLSPSGGHNVADLEWGSDGTMLVGAGDGAHFETMDAGGLDPGQFLPGRSNPAEDLGAFRSQSLISANGKILRIDPATGLGLPSNPYWDGNPASKRSRVWAYGFRNPFRMTRRPGTGSADPAIGSPGTLYVGDVGWSSWEEVDVVATPGSNFGWPCFEGPFVQPDYDAATPSASGCGTLGMPSNPALPQSPLVSLARDDPSLSDPPGVTGSVMVGGVFYTGSSYPARYQGRYFFGDYTDGWIRMLTTDAADHKTDLEEFGSDFGGLVSFAVSPVNGDLYCATIWDGLIHRIRWTGTAGVAPPAGPAGASLSPARPNPARGPVGFDLHLPAPARVGFEVLDLGGRRVWSEAMTERAAGASTLFWAGIEASGAAARPGVYLARVRAGERTLVRRFALVR